MATESISFFDLRSPERTSSLLPSQIDPSSPMVDGLHRATNLLLPDLLTSERMAHFPADQYDLRPSSHLMRFVRALLGDSGVGSSRKRYLVSRLQQSPWGTHFSDLDRFYGALFGIQRVISEQYGLNPYEDLATADEWDAIHTADTHYRERLYGLARAIPMGGTMPGLKTAAEAILGTPVEVFERWQEIDWMHSHGWATSQEVSGNSWGDVQAMGTYDDLEEIGSWYLIAGTGQPGLAINNRSEVVVRPVRRYDVETDRGRLEKAQDERMLRQVLSVLKPATVKLTLDMTGEGLYTPLALRDVLSDSNYYEVIARISPSNRSYGGMYPITNGQRVAGVTAADDRVIARPPFTASSGGVWNYNNEVVSVRGYTEDGVTQVVDETISYERVSNIYGEIVNYTPEQGLLDPRQAEAGRLSGDTSLVSHPYAADRRVVLAHG